jgi:hypothetical protein
MTRKLASSDLPYWPRLLSRELAAAYVGVSPDLFDDEVKAGLWPDGRPRGRGSIKPRKTWDRRQIDAVLDDALNINEDGGVDDYEQRRAKAAARRQTGSQAAQ